MKWTTLICGSCIECSIIQYDSMMWTVNKVFFRRLPLWLIWRHVSPQTRLVWDRFAKAYSTMFNDVRASTNAVFRYFSQPSGVPAERLGHAMAILGMNPTEDEDLWRQLLLLCFALRLLRLLLPSRVNVHRLLKCFYHFYLPAAMRSKSIWQISVVQNTLTKRCFTVS